MHGIPFRPRVERAEDRLAPAVAVPGVIAAPPDFFGGASLVVDFDHDGTTGAPIPFGTPIADQYAPLGVRFSLRDRTDFPVTSSPSFVDAISAPNTLFVRQGDPASPGAGAVTVARFDPAVLPNLPTAVGFVFTDCPPGGFTARAFDSAGAVVDQVSIDTANTSFVPRPGDTEDTFIGLQSAGGIARVEFSSADQVGGTVTGYEIDNFRFNTPGTPLPPPPPGAGPGTPAPGTRAPDLAVATANTLAQVYRVGADDQLVPQGGPVNPFGRPGVVRAASGDVDGDGATDLVYATGPGGGALVRVISGRTGEDLVAGGTFDTFPGEDLTTIGLFVAVGDVTADGKAEVFVSPDRGGGPRVQIFGLDGGTLVRRANFFGITGDPGFRGGARIATGNLDGDEFTDLVVSAGILGGPRIAVFDGSSLTGPAVRKLVGDFFVFEPTVRDGVYVGAGDLDGDGQAEMVFGGGPGGGPRVMVLKLPAVIADPVAAVSGGNPLANFFAFDPNQRGGVRVSVKRVDGEDRGDLIVGSGDGTNAQVRVYRGATLTGSPSAAQGIDLFGAPLVPFGVFVG
ncbi:MAG: hypothetical protein K2X87_19695 [Gemmataceae bacterium]|nr:hypothetical protein [Gemmataceae bacterium]